MYGFDVSALRSRPSVPRQVSSRSTRRHPRIIEVTDGGRSGRLRAIVRLTNVGEDGVERADPHGLRVRRLR